MRGYLVGVFASNSDQKLAFENSVAKRNEAEGITVFLRSEGGTKYSFLDDSTFPEKIQGYARIASISDHAYYIFPNDGKLSAADGELAVLLDSLGVRGTIEVIDADASAYSEIVKKTFKGVSISEFPIEQRNSKSSVLTLSQIEDRDTWPKNSTLIYIDRAFNVKGVGLVVLGFVLSGKVSIHDKLRMIPRGTKLAEVKGIQVNDEDQDSAERGIRVGLSLKGVELKDLEKVSWLDDGTLDITKRITVDFNQSRYYKQDTLNRDAHLQANGDLLVAKLTPAETPTRRILETQKELPVWEKMPVSILDLNAKPLRVMGGGRLLSWEKAR